MGLHPLEQEVLKRWKSFRRLYTFLEKEFCHINQQCFQGRLPAVLLRLNRMKFARDILDKGYVVASYRPPHDERRAQIEFFPMVLLEKKDALTALAHEMVHHWEWLHGEKNSEGVYLLEIHEIPRQFFQNPEREYKWRLAHSSKFITKAFEVAEKLCLPLQDFLFKAAS